MINALFFKPLPLYVLISGYNAATFGASIGASTKPKVSIAPFGKTMSKGKVFPSFLNSIGALRRYVFASVSSNESTVPSLIALGNFTAERASFVSIGLKKFCCAFTATFDKITTKNSSIKFLVLEINCIKINF